ncbi:hypothetical protein [Vagococcus carniphilus]|uniref:hypothetical protein n=1 Tax=Vagococcus carniphilus TaxID=218144 RepID=UPI0028911A92|nr:hypothetical protein [Vagococcus carniphilus]MDT2864168.1 hypothetical protein [Vagococcus carniphilus]
MINCKECGREINEGKKRCAYCQSKLVPITSKKLLNKTMNTSKLVAKSVVDTSSTVSQKTKRELDKMRATQQQKSIIKKKKKIEKLERQIEKSKTSDNKD